MSIVLAWVVPFSKDVVTGPFEVKELKGQMVSFYNRQSARINTVFYNEEDAIKFCLEQAERRFNRTKARFTIRDN